MKKHLFPFRTRRQDRAFSLVEVALALGVVGFALVGIVGALPVAMNNERLSVAQTRAASVASTIFARFRAQSFKAVLYSDDSTDSLDLNTLNTILNSDPTKDAPVTTAYAVLDESLTPADAATATTKDSRRLHIYSTAPAGVACYKVVFRFKNSLPGMLAPYNDASGAMHASGNAIELSVFQDPRPTDATYAPKVTDTYHFNTVIANRAQ